LGSGAGKVINIGMFVVRRGKKLGKSGYCTLGRGEEVYFYIKTGKASQ
jgi:hypothetical protein